MLFKQLSYFARDENTQIITNKGYTSELKRKRVRKQNGTFALSVCSNKQTTQNDGEHLYKEHHLFTDFFNERNFFKCIF